MASILKVRDADGTVHEIYALQGKSAYQYAVEGGYTGTETEFSAKLAQEKFANPNALSFTGAVTGSYDGSEPLTVEIPSGGGETADLPVLQSFTIEGDETNKIEFTDLPNLTEFEVELKWIWSSTSGNSTVSVWLEPGFGNYNNRVLNIANGLMRGSSMSLEIFGKRISNTMQNILVTGGPVAESVTDDHNSQITAKKSVTYIGIQATTSGVYFVNGTTVTLRGR